ncbi:MAG TPA: SAM-dependent methyltransferase [Polyangiaceae bacterium]|nr:SAM-dependent methyltransferase [Polyangiaceae bacterium]
MTLADLPAASALMSSRWSQDNLVTAHPAQLYDGRVNERLGAEALDYLIQDLVEQRGPFDVIAGRMGVFTWDVVCKDDTGRFVLQVPLALDEPGTRGRAKRDVPRSNLENARYFRERGLARFVSEPRRAWTLAGGVPAAEFGALDRHFPVTFGAGAVRVRLPDGWLLPLGPAGTADVLVEMVAALVYHYEPEVAGGTALTDVFVNDGDFALRRRGDGSLDVRLTAARRREPGIGPNLFLLYLVQLMAYEDFSVDGALTGLPALFSNPSIAFEGVVRGSTYRARDLGAEPAEGERRARAWIADFGRSREGHAYRPWVDRFLGGELEPSFGADPREHWWRLFPLERKQSLLELRGRRDAGAADSARALRSFLERLSREIGRLPEDEPDSIRPNDLDGEGMRRLLADARVDATSLDAVMDETFAHWPFRSLDPWLARVPRARGLRRLKSRLVFGAAFPVADEGSLKSLGAPPKAASRRPFANDERFGALSLPAALHAAAARTFPTFEAYMDAALHDPAWGYYGHRVVIGKGGHFDTHPEELAPHYGRWIAGWAFKAWCEMLARGELGADDPFRVIEFGAGNGRLARDFLDAVSQAAADAANRERESWHAFAARLRYHVYEMSEALRARQQELVGERAIIAPGDARRPGATLRRDFPDGVRGFVVTNEVPDAFGVHKVALAADGVARAALVLPRIEPALAEALEPALRDAVVRTDATLRQTFALAHNAPDRYLDARTFADVMAALAALDERERDARLAALWFEEAYVPTSVLPELAAHLRVNAREYALALAAEESGVVVYVNVHADGFVRELGGALASGFVVTIDYGQSTWGLVHGARRGDFPFRVYGAGDEYVPRPNDPYAAPGSQDMTADVNFTSLAAAGRAAGLELVHFGPERDVLGDSLAEVVRTLSEREPFAKFLGNPGFRVLVLGTRPSEAFSSPLMTPLLINGREQDVPKSLRDRIQPLERQLSGEAIHEQTG